MFNNKYSKIQIQKYINCRLNKLKAITQVQIKNAIIYKIIDLNFVQKNKYINKIQVIIGIIIFIIRAFNKSKIEVSNILFIVF